MNTLKITVFCDRKAALLNGLILGETCEVEVSPETIGTEWPRLVKLLNMSVTPPALPRDGGYPGWGISVEVAAATPEAVKAALEKLVEWEEEQEDGEKRKREAEVAAMEAGAELYERMLTEPLTAAGVAATAAQCAGRYE